MRNLIIEMILQGKTYREIIEATGAAKSTISYHAAKLGNPNRRKLGDGAQLAITMITDLRSNQEIVAETGLSLTRICELRKQLGIAATRGWTEAEWFEFQKLYDSGISIRECCSQLGISVNSAYKARAAGLLNFKKVKREYDEVLVEGSTYQRGNLKRRLIADGFLVPVCVECGIGNEWNGKPLTLHLDHKNGVNNDNRIDNLRLLCPNCHSQTETFAGRNVKR